MAVHKVILGNEEGKISADAIPSSILDSIAEKQLKNVFDPRDYGFISEWNNDNTAAFQSAIDAAESAGGGSVIIPSVGEGGRWKVTNLYLGTGVRLLGFGDYSRLWQAAGATGPIISLKGNGLDVFNVCIDSLMVQGNKLEQTSVNDGIFLDNSGGSISHNARHTIKNVTVQHCSGNGINIGERVRGTLVSDVRVMHCDQSGVLWNAHDSRFTGGEIDNCGMEGLRITGGATHFSDIKVWYCGKSYLDDAANRYAGILVAGDTVMMSNIQTQENYCEGVYVYKAGNTIKGFRATGLTLDSDNLGDSGSVAFRAYRIQGAQVSMNVRKHLGGQPTFCLSVGGTQSVDNHFDISQDGFTNAQVIPANTETAQNYINCNGSAEGYMSWSGISSLIPPTMTGSRFTVNLDKDMTIGIPYPNYYGRIFTIVLNQDSVGGHTVSWDAQYAEAPVVEVTPDTTHVYNVTLIDGVWTFINTVDSTIPGAASNYGSVLVIEWDGTGTEPARNYPTGHPLAGTAIPAPPEIYVEWRSPVQPSTNAVDGDSWVDTSV